MANHAVLILNKSLSFDVGSFNRTAIAASGVDLDNGNIFRLDSQTSGSSGVSECWWVTAPTYSASTANNVWMAASPEVVWTIDGTLNYRGLNQDPRRFYNKGGYAFDAVAVKRGDVFTLTADGILGGATPSSVIQPTEGAFTWSPVTTASTVIFPYAVTSASLIGTTYISIGSGAIDNQRTTAYKFAVITE
jgi:hypothetical protein